MLPGERGGPRFCPGQRRRTSSPQQNAVASDAYTPFSLNLEGCRPKFASMSASSSNSRPYRRGPLEMFTCQLSMYHWMLDHPDHGRAHWRRLGAKCSDIDNRGNGRFGWHERAGADIHWDTSTASPASWSGMPRDRCSQS